MKFSKLSHDTLELYSINYLKKKIIGTKNEVMKCFVCHRKWSFLIHWENLKNWCVFQLKQRFEKNILISYITFGDNWKRRSPDRFWQTIRGHIWRQQSTFVTWLQRYEFHDISHLPWKSKLNLSNHLWEIACLKRKTLIITTNYALYFLEIIQQLIEYYCENLKKNAFIAFP